MMKHIPKQKLSKKVRREQDSKNRLSWGLVKPVTRQEENKKCYNRKKVQRGFDEYSCLNLF